MANNTISMSTYKARIMAHNPANTTTFLRGDNVFTNVLTGNLWIGQCLELHSTHTEQVIEFQKNSVKKHQIDSADSNFSIFTNTTFSSGTLTWRQDLTIDRSTGKITLRNNTDVIGFLNAIKSSGETYVQAKNDKARVYLHVSSNGSHGIYSDGYYNGSSFVSSEKYLIVRDTNNYCYINASVHSPWYYPDGELLPTTTAASLCNGNMLQHGFMKGGPWGSGDYSSVLYWSGYDQWGAVQLAPKYNSDSPGLKMRVFVQSDGGRWGNWTEFVKNDSGTWSISISGSAASLTNTRTIWGQNFNGTQNISGDLHSAGPGFYLPSGQTILYLYSNNSGATAGNLEVNSIGISSSYSGLDHTNYGIDCNKAARFKGGHVLITNNHWLQIINYGVTLEIGPMNSSWSHFQSTANFYFQPSVCVDGNVYPYTNNNKYCGTSDRKWVAVYATTFYGDLSGNASSASRINGNLGGLSDSDEHNIWVSSTSGVDGIPKYVSGVYIVPSSKTIVATTFYGNATTATSATTANKISHSTYYYSGNVLKNSVGPTALFGESPTQNYVFPAFMENHPKFGGYADVLMWTGYCKWGGTQLAALYNASNPSLAIRKMVQGGSQDNWGNWRYVWCEGNSVTNAVWNDLAECRKSSLREPGYAITPAGSRTTKRLEPACRITSDTWGFALGDENDETKMPVAISGRVLAYPYRPREEYHLGDCVCSAPDGKVDIMTREEIRNWPDCIIGMVNEIPDYDEWGSDEKDNTGRDKVKVNGRIWIDIK